MTFLKHFSPVFALIAIFAVAALSQPELDPTFNMTGRQITTGGIGWGTLVQSDNKIIVFGRSPADGGSFGAVRYNENGSIDASFGTNGFVETDFDPGLNDAAFSGSVQSDGKIVLAGVTSFNAILLGNFALVRYNVDGSLDTSFGSGGKVVSNVETSGEDAARSVTIQTDGKILVVGQTVGVFPGAQIIVRYDSAGVPDPTFGTGGVVRTTVAGHSIWGESVRLQPDGKILVGGGMHTIPAPPTPTAYYTLTRYHPDGTPDGSFGDGGRIAMVYGLGGQADINIRSIAVQPNGRILAAGWDSVLFRFNADGSPDNTFDGDGTLRPVMNGGEPKSLILSPSGKITVVGNRAGDFAISRYNADGSVDTTFSDDGHLLVDVGNSTSDLVGSAAIDSIGRIVVGGSSAVTYAAIRLSPVAANAAVSGRVTAADGRGVFNASLTMQRDGTEFVARTNPFGYYRFLQVPVGSYTITVNSKSFSFPPRAVKVFEDLSNIDFVAER